MTNNKLSEIEIKLINISKKFAEEQNQKEGSDSRYSVGMEENPGRKNNSSVYIKFPYEHKSLVSFYARGRGVESVSRTYSIIVSANYEGNAINGPIKIGRLKNEEYIVNFQNAYKNFLIKEIPEIKDRIE